MSAEHPTYQLVFRALAGDGPPIVRLRRLLKLALRGFGFRCLDCRELAGELGLHPQKRTKIKGGTKQC